jgi:hydrogenase/urease accessory protein HupE
MKERTIVTSVVALLAGILILSSGNTDVIYVVVSIAFFGLCTAYAEGCEKL